MNQEYGREGVGTDPGSTGSADRAPPGRAGRNLPAAIGVGLGLGGVIVGSLVVERGAFVAVVIVAVLIALWELGNALGARDLRPPLVPIAIGAVAMQVAAFQGGPESLVVALALTVLGVLGWRVAEGPHGFVRDSTAGIFIATYLPFLAGFAVLMNAADDDGAGRVATFILLIVCSDVGGYTAGVLIGRRPLAPRISPKKSWEGLGGSLLACAGGGAVCLTLILDEAWWKGVLLGLALALSATLGDLGESVLKRDLGVKDMGTLLPGHGGLLDRLDSLLVGAPVAWLLLSAMVPVGS